MNKVTRLFLSGILKGMTHTELTNVKFEEGFICNKTCTGGSGYKIIKIEEC